MNKIKDEINESLSKDLKELIDDLYQIGSRLEADREFLKYLAKEVYDPKDSMELLSKYQNKVIEIYDNLKEDLVEGYFDVKERR